MPLRRKRASKSLAIKAAELAFAAPQVVAHRVTRMALAGSTPSERDRVEFELMVAEKKIAFAASWNAMAAQAVLVNQQLASSYFRSFWSSASRGKLPKTPSVAQLSKAAFSVLNKGIAPVHSKAVANAKRLARTKLR